MTHTHEHPPTPWQHDGVRVVKANQLDSNTAQTPGMSRSAAINFARVGAQNCGRALSRFMPTQKPAPTTTGTWKA